MEFVRQTIEINGCKLSLARGGKGVPLMYLHGPDGLADWPAILDTLADRFDVIVPDHPGFGASEAPAWIDDISDVAYCYLDVIETPRVPVPRNIRNSPFSTALPARVSVGSRASSIRGWSAGCIGWTSPPTSSGAMATASFRRPMPRRFIA